MEGEHHENTLATAGVLEKYQAAGKIAQVVMAEVIAKCIDGASINELCVFGNKRIYEEVAKVYNNKKFEKGPAFPVCISVNEVCGNFCPISEETQKLNKGDLAKINLGVQIDCFPVVLAHSIIVGGETNVAERQRVASAAWNALQVAVKSVKLGNSNTTVAQMINETAALYETSKVDGVLGHELKQYMIDGNRVIVRGEPRETKADNFNFELNDIFGVDVLLSSGEGKVKESEARVTVYKRNIDANYDLKSKNGRFVLSEARDKFFDFAFSLNDFEDQLVI